MDRSQASLDGIARSCFARFSLSFAKFVLGLNCIAAVIGGFAFVAMGAAEGDWGQVLTSIVAAVVGFVLSFAWLVVFHQVIDSAFFRNGAAGTSQPLRWLPQPDAHHITSHHITSPAQTVTMCRCIPGRRDRL